MMERMGNMMQSNKVKMNGKPCLSDRSKRGPFLKCEGERKRKSSSTIEECKIGQIQTEFRRCTACFRIAAVTSANIVTVASSLQFGSTAVRLFRRFIRGARGGKEV
jgi:hypothetical protein